MVFIYFVIPIKVKYLWLLATSYFFYMCWNVKYVFLILFSTLVTWICAMALEYVKSGNMCGKAIRKKKKTIVIISLFLNLSLLFYFKYINLAIETIQKILKTIHIELNIPSFSIVLPVGISFFIFQALGYTIDVYRDEITAEKNFFRYALFVSFFPQLVAGPIERSKNLLYQMSRKPKFDYIKARSGLLTMAYGLFLKL